MLISYTPARRGLLEPSHHRSSRHVEQVSEASVCGRGSCHWAGRMLGQGQSSAVPQAGRLRDIGLGARGL